MNIRSRITIQFIIIVALIIFSGSVFIYFFSATYRKDEFYSRLINKASNTAKLLIEVDEVDLALLKKIETDNPISLPNEKIVIFNNQNEIIYSTDETKEIAITATLLKRIRAEEEVTFNQDSYEAIGFLFKDDDDHFVVVAAATDIYGHNKLRNLRTILIIAFIISIILVSVSGWFYAANALGPISKVIQQVDEISIASLNLRVDEGNGKDEIAMLAHTFNQMLDRLESSFKVQRNFIANASHELRTPLTAITGQLEVSLMSERSREEYERVLNSVLEDIKSLNILSNRLLLLAQTSSDGFQLKESRIRIDEIMWLSREEVLRHYPAYSIKIDIDSHLDDENKLVIKGDEQLIKAAFVNLMENGCKYSSPNAVEIMITYTTNRIRIYFKDSGIGIDEKELPNIFDPFFRGKNVTNIKGHGIGLSMVKRIIVAHGGAITIDSKLGRGTTVSVQF